MKLWKKTVFLMLATLLMSLFLVGGLTLFITGKQSVKNMAQTNGRQLLAAAGMLEQFWDSAKYKNMTEVGKASYRNFQFRKCCGEGYVLLENGKTVENTSGYGIVDLEALHVKEAEEDYDCQLQFAAGEAVMLQKTMLEKPEGHMLLSVRNVTGLYEELLQLAAGFLAVYGVVFALAGFFIWRRMKRTVQVMEYLEEVAQKQEFLLGAIAHEMKTPLTSIVGYSDSLLHVNLQDSQKESALTHINREGQRLSRLSEKLLELLGLYRNESIEMEPQSVSELVRRVEELETEVALGRGILLWTEYEEFSLRMDMELMESLLVNLVDNAIHACEPGRRVILRAVCKENEKLLEVEDNGRGIPQKELARVTEAFYMVDKSRTRKEGGAGLGLALCGKIAELHGGALEIKSREGKGTMVTVRFGQSA